MPNYFNAPQYQPYAPTYPSMGMPQRQQGNLIWVNSLDGAKAYSMMPNTNVILLDNTEPYLYLKSTDAANFPTIERFKIEKDPIAESASQSAEIQYATHEEVAALSSKLDTLMQVLESKNEVMGVPNVQSNIQQPATTTGNPEPNYEQGRPVQGSNDGGHQGNIRPNAGQSSSEW